MTYPVTPPSYTGSMDDANSIGWSHNPKQPAADVWVALPGGELEGKCPRRVCGRCQSHPGTLCFDCYRAEFTRERRLKRAAAVDTGSEERFQQVLPLEPVHFG